MWAIVRHSCILIAFRRHLLSRFVFPKLVLVTHPRKHSSLQKRGRYHPQLECFYLFTTPLAPFTNNPFSFLFSLSINVRKPPDCYTHYTEGPLFHSFSLQSQPILKLMPRRAERMRSAGSVRLRGGKTGPLSNGPGRTADSLSYKGTPAGALCAPRVRQLAQAKSPCDQEPLDSRIGVAILCARKDDVLLGPANPNELTWQRPEFKTPVPWFLVDLKCGCLSNLCGEQQELPKGGTTSDSVLYSQEATIDGPMEGSQLKF